MRIERNNVGPALQDSNSGGQRSSQGGGMRPQISPGAFPQARNDNQRAAPNPGSFGIDSRYLHHSSTDKNGIITSPSYPGRYFVNLDGHTVEVRDFNPATSTWRVIDPVTGQPGPAISRNQGGQWQWTENGDLSSTQRGNTAQSGDGQPRGNVAQSVDGQPSESAAQSGGASARERLQEQKAAQTDSHDELISSQSLNPGAAPQQTFPHSHYSTYLLQNSWSINTPSGRMDNVHFPTRIDYSARTGQVGKTGGSYFSQIFKAEVNSPGNPFNGEYMGYIGIQPMEQDGKARAIFSGFGYGLQSSTGDGGADLGHGVTNRKIVDFQYGHKYDLSVEADKNNPSALNGYIQDVTNPTSHGPKTHIGNIILPGPGNILGHSDSNIGFVEQFGTPIDHTSQLHRVQGTFYSPYTETRQGTQYGQTGAWSTQTDFTRPTTSNNIVGSTGTVRASDPNTGSTSYGSSFNVRGAGWVPGTRIPWVDTHKD